MSEMVDGDGIRGLRGHQPCMATVTHALACDGPFRCCGLLAEGERLASPVGDSELSHCSHPQGLNTSRTSLLAPLYAHPELDT